MKSSSCLPLFLGAAVHAATYHGHDQHGIDPDNCETTTILPTVTIIKNGDRNYEQCYTVTYDQWCSDGLCPHAYTVTETCTEAPCRGPEETGLPPGFTRAAVACSSCGGEGEVATQTLTFPVAAIESLTSAGYAVAHDAAPTETSEPPRVTSDTHEHEDGHDDDYPVQAGGARVWVNGGLFGALGLLVAAM